jgi:NAD(P)H dehydrogenase (quinone)
MVRRNNVGQAAATGSMPMHVLLVYAHPRSDSFCAALRDSATAALTSAGHTIKLCDLYADGFVPAMTEQQRGRYYTDAPDLLDLENHIAALQRADALLLVYPTWWFGMPAMLKGWFDRVWVPGVAFRLRQTGGLEPLLTNISRIGVITTYGSPRWLLWLIRWPDRRIVKYGFRSLCAPRCRLDWIAMNGMDTCTVRQRSRFIERVALRLSRW